MNAIILAAGVGSRMEFLTKNKPKCFLKVNGELLISRLLRQLRALGIKDISIVTGYKSNRFKFDNVTYFVNRKFSKTNMLYSLMRAQKKMRKDTLILYSDIFLSDNILNKMLKVKKGFAVGVDINWKKYWQFRFNNVFDDLETLKINKLNHIKEIGKPTNNLDEIDARYIGVIKTNKFINKQIISIWNYEKNKSKQNWGISGNSLNKAYLTDLINNLINSKKKIKCHAIKFRNGWYEFDNKKDYYKFMNYKKRLV